MQLKTLFVSLLALGTACSAATTYPDHAKLVRGVPALDPKVALVDPVVHLNLTLVVPIREIEQALEATAQTLAAEGKKIVDITEELASGLAEFIKPYAEDIIDAVESTAEFLEATLAKVGKAAVVLTDELKSAAGAIAQGLGSLLHKVEQVGALLRDTLIEELHGIAQAGVFLFTQLGDLVQGLVRALDGTLEQLVVRANKVGADVEGLLGALGKSLGQILHDLLFG